MSIITTHKMIPLATAHLKEGSSDDFLGTETLGSFDVTGDPVFVALAAVVTLICCAVAVSGEPVGLDTT